MPTIANNSAKANSNEEEDVEENFFTPVTSVKSKPKIERKEGDKVHARTRLLPTPRKMQSALPSPEKIRDIRKAELEKFKEEARLRARLKSDEELGISETPSKYKRTVSSESSQSASDRAPLSEKEDPSQKVTFNPGIPESSGTPKQSKSKKKKSQSRESTLSSNENLDAETPVYDFTDTDEDAVSCTSLNDTHRRIKSDHGPLSEEELNARITRKIQHAARKQLNQQKRLLVAKEIQQKLQEVDVKQRELEELIMVSARELELKDRQGRLQSQLRASLSLRKIRALSPDAPHTRHPSTHTYRDQLSRPAPLSCSPLAVWRLEMSCQQSQPSTLN